MIDVSSGSLTAVDTESLRGAAARLDGAAERLRGLTGDAQAAALQIAFDPNVHDGRAWDVHENAARAVGRINKVATDLRHAADRYEFADLRFQMMLLSYPALGYANGGLGRPGRRAQEKHDAELEALRERWRELSESNPRARDEAMRDWAAWRAREDGGLQTWGDGADRVPLVPWTGLPLPGIGTATSEGAEAAIAMLALGVVPAGAKLTGRGDPVTVRPTALQRATSAPGSLREAAERIPDGETDARIRIETYEMPGGTREHVLYLAGTKGGGDDAWDWGSNIDLYNNRRSASFVGLEQALAEAGVREGEAVHGVGFSQGAMVAARLATEGDYDVRSLIGFGSPIDVAGLDDVLQVSVRHTDDLVPALANGGNPAEGIVIEALYDADDGAHDILIPAHRLHAYVETAADVDASGDPRLDALDDLFAHLGEADSVEFVEFGAERTN